MKKNFSLLFTLSIMVSLFTFFNPSESFANCTTEHRDDGNGGMVEEHHCGGIDPKITQPENFSVFYNTRRPEIKFKVDNTQDGDLDNIKLYLDDVMVDKWEGTAATSEEHTWIPGNDLAFGPHTVKLYAHEQRENAESSQTTQDVNFSIEHNKIELDLILPAIGQTEDGRLLDEVNPPLPNHEIGAAYLTITGNLTQPATVEVIDLGTGTAEAGFDYTFQGPAIINIPAGDYTEEPGLIKIPGITVINDDKPQKMTGDGPNELPEDQVIKFRVQNVVGENIVIDDGDGNNFINFDYFIKDDSDLYVITPEITQTMVEPSQDLIVKLKLNYPIYEGYNGGGITIFYQLESKEDSPLLKAEDGVDFMCVGSPGITFNIGEQEKIMTNCHIIDDLEIEGDEKFQITFGAGGQIPEYKYFNTNIGERFPVEIIIRDNDSQSKGKSGKKHSGAGGSKSHKKVCKDSRALNFNNVGQHDVSLCKYGKFEKKGIKEKIEEKKEEGKEEDKKTEKNENKKESIFKCDAKYLGDDILEQKSSMDVLKLQKFLNKFENEVLEENGEYNKFTIDAVNRYQFKYAIDILNPWKLKKPNGKVFPTMRGHINNRYRISKGCEEVCTAEKKFTKYLRLGDKGEEVEKVQRFLLELGFYKGEINGIFGQTTKDAVRDFQNENWEYVLKPWGIPCKCGTGYWYQTTRFYANSLIGCKNKNSAKPKLKHGKEPIACVKRNFPNLFR